LIVIAGDIVNFLCFTQPAEEIRQFSRDSDLSFLIHKLKVGVLISSNLTIGSSVAFSWQILGKCLGHTTTIGIGRNPYGGAIPMRSERMSP